MLLAPAAPTDCYFTPVPFYERVLAQSPTEKKQGETITLQDTKNKHPLNENNFCGSGYPQFFVRDIEPNLSHARREEGGWKWDFRWDVGTNNPTRGPRSHTKHETNPGITPQRGFVRPHFRVGSRW